MRRSFIVLCSKQKLDIKESQDKGRSSHVCYVWEVYVCVQQQEFMYEGFLHSRSDQFLIRGVWMWICCAKVTTQEQIAQLMDQGNKNRSVGKLNLSRAHAKTIRKTHDVWMVADVRLHDDERWFLSIALDLYGVHLCWVEHPPADTSSCYFGLGASRNECTRSEQARRFHHQSRWAWMTDTHIIRQHNSVLHV